jgi:membrane fusion protein (multidrug efflux system)
MPKSSRPSLSIMLAAAAILSACSKTEPPPAAKPPAVVGVVTVTSEAVPVDIELAGRTKPFQIAEVRPQVAGIVLRRPFAEGADVKAGQLLYQIDPAPYAAAVASAEASLARAEASALTARNKDARNRELIQANAISRQEADDSAAALKQAEADVAATKAALELARINLRYTQISAPVSGRAGLSTVTTGALVTANQAAALTTVQQLDPIYVDVTQTTAQLLALRRALAEGRLTPHGQEAVKVRLLLEDGSAYAQEGKLLVSDATVDQGTGSVTLRAVFPNPKHELLPGMFVRARLEEGVNQHGMLVPQQGVTHDARGRATALVVAADSTVEQRELALGDAVGNKWIVLKGLKAGDRLIVDGLQKIKPGAPVTPQPWAGPTAAAQR